MMLYPQVLTSMPHVIKHKASPKYPDLNEIAPFIEPGLQVSRFWIFVVEFLALQPTETQNAKHQNLWPRPPPQLCRVLQLQKLRNKEPRPLVFENTEMLNPDAFSKGWLPNETFHRFGVSDFTISRIRMQDSWLCNLQNPKMVNKV
jgi:hypothetical protein